MMCLISFLPYTMSVSSSAKSVVCWRHTTNTRKAKSKKRYSILSVMNTLHLGIQPHVILCTRDSMMTPYITQPLYVCLPNLSLSYIGTSTKLNSINLYFSIARRCKPDYSSPENNIKYGWKHDAGLSMMSLSWTFYRYIFVFDRCFAQYSGKLYLYEGGHCVGGNQAEEGVNLRPPAGLCQTGRWGSQHDPFGGRMQGHYAVPAR